MVQNLVGYVGGDAQARHPQRAGYEMASCYRLYFLPIDFDLNRRPQHPICENFKAADVRGLQRKSQPGLHFIPSPHSSGDSLKDIFPLRGAVGPDDDIAVPTSAVNDPSSIVSEPRLDDQSFDAGLLRIPRARSDQPG